MQVDENGKKIIGPPPPQWAKSWGHMYLILSSKKASNGLNLVWFGKVWFDMTPNRFGMVWYDMVILDIII